MRNLFSLVLLIGIMTGLVACGSTASDDPKTWLVLVYLDADNNLDSYGRIDLAEMINSPYSKYMKVIVQTDFLGESTKRYRVGGGSKELIADLGELDMASPTTITDFLTWAKGAYSADRTVLILWNHGNGWDQNDGPHPRSILYDDDSGSDFLSNHEVRKAIDASGVKPDLLGLDASIMGTLEAMYEFRSISPLIVASEEVGHSAGWDYISVLGCIASHPDNKTENLASTIVRSYKKYFEEDFYLKYPQYEQYHNIIALRTDKLAPIASEVGRIANELTTRLSSSTTEADTVALLKDTRKTVQPIDKYVQPFVYADLSDLGRILNDKGVTNTLPTLIASATVDSYIGSARPSAHGLSIVFFDLPNATKYRTYDENYSNWGLVNGIGNGGDFINDFGWDEFLNTFYKKAGLL